MTKARLPSRSVVRPDQPPRDLADERVGRGKEAEVRPAVLGRDAEGLALARGDIGAVCAGWRQDRERDGLDDRDEQRPGAVCEPADLGHRLEQPEEVRLAGDDAGHRPIGFGQEPLERRQVGRPGVRSVGDDRDLLDLEAAPEVGLDRLAVVGMNGPRHEDPLAAGRPAGHQAPPPPWPPRRRNARRRRRRDPSARR